MLLNFMMNIECLAYVGPGAGLSLIGTLLAVVAVLALAVLAPVVYAVQFVWGVLRRKRTSG